QTVGKLCDGKTPRQIEKLRILDPACGSGSFLIGAYDHLLTYHRDWYVEDGPDKHKKELYQTPAGDWRLTTQEKKRILLNNIYGVDIDPQAVEVTKLSLLLKVLEGESDETLKRQLSFVKERALPDLGQNIKCGNSLIGPDYFREQLLPDEEEMRRINPFDWEAGFPEIMKAGGFDAVIGNPPYLNVDDTWGEGDPRLKALKSQYPEIYNDKTDILFYFLGKAAQLSKAMVGFIVSRAFLEAYKADKLRHFLLTHSAVQRIIDFQNHHVFQGVGITTCILIYHTRTGPRTIDVFKLKRDDLISFSQDDLSDPSLFEHIQVDQHSLNREPWNFASESVAKLNDKIDKRGCPLKDVLLIGQGMQTGTNDVFGNRTKREIQKWKLKKGTYFKRAANSDIGRFSIKDRGEYLVFLEEVSSFNKLPNGLQKYLIKHAAELKKRAAYKRGNCEWWKYTWPLHKQYYNRRRILCPYLAMSNRFAIDLSSEFIGLTDTTVLFENNQPENLFYLLGLLNSKLLSFRFKSIGKLKGGGIYEYFWNSVSRLPIRRIDLSAPTDKAKHDQMVTLVEHMLDLHKRLAAATHPDDRTRLQRQIDATDREIDRLVYDLYGLTEEEIAIVEGTMKV
ncbi:MAG: Eco57I restriction-modification methylase domain-containing protein, partial [Nitrospiraceae bacterium]